MDCKDYIEDTELSSQITELILDPHEDVEKLHNRLNQFNVFNILKFTAAEIRHSNVLTWLLDPYENHKLGSQFLEKFVKQILINNSVQAYTSAEADLIINQDEIEKKQWKPFTVVQFNDINYHNVEIRREWRHIDILIIIKGAIDLVIPIENKIYSNEIVKDGEKEGQLKKYLEVCKGEFEKSMIIPVFLTIEGISASEENKEYWHTMSYEYVVSILESIIQSNSGLLGTNIIDFIKQYQSVVRSFIMEEQETRDLVQSLYAKYNKVIDYVINFKKDTSFQLREDLIKMVKSNLGEANLIITDYKNTVEFSTDSIRETLFFGKPASDVFRFWVGIGESDVYLRFTIRDIEDKDIRKKAYQFCHKNASAFNKAGKSESRSDRWTTVYSTKLLHKDTNKDYNIKLESMQKKWDHFIKDDLVKINDLFHGEII